MSTMAEEIDERYAIKKELAKATLGAFTKLPPAAQGLLMRDYRSSDNRDLWKQTHTTRADLIKRAQELVKEAMRAAH
jgi:hypothetical protein